MKKQFDLLVDRIHDLKRIDQFDKDSLLTVLERLKQRYEILLEAIIEAENDEEQLKCNEKSMSEELSDEIAEEKRNEAQELMRNCREYGE